uniref:Cholinergic receptor, nicotinic, alpha 7a (neuronal) n=1 Tax=Cynoglossus semilaevis TaxID=244447 RepID=A0A3P8VLQ4_CYNSE
MRCSFWFILKMSTKSKNKVKVQDLYLLRDYNSLSRPVANETDKLTVTVGLTLMQIMDVNEKNQILTANVWLPMEWKDNNLKWDVENYPGVTNMRFRHSQVWSPDILLYNSADERFDPTFHTNILVAPSGNCTYIPPGIFKSICSVNMRWFPFDVQKCELKFGSWTYDGHMVDLKMGTIDTTLYTDNGEWHLVDVKGKRSVTVYECCPEPYVDVTFTLVMQRRTSFYAFYFLLPCILISIMAVMVFLLPPDSGEKITLGITVLLSMVVFMLLIAQVIPASSDTVPLIAQYFAVILVIVALSVAATVVVLHFHHHDPRGCSMPKWIRVLLLDFCPRFLCMKLPGEGRRQSPGDKAQRGSMSSMELNIPISTPATPADSSGEKKGKCEDAMLLLNGGEKAQGKEPELVKILEEVRYIARQFYDQDKDKLVSNDWKFAAAVLDRLCLVAFSIVTFLCTVVMLMSAPSTE